MKQIKNPFKKINDGYEKFISMKVIKQIWKFLPHNLWIFIFMIFSFIMMINFALPNNYDPLYANYEASEVIPVGIKNYEYKYDIVPKDTYQADLFGLRIGTYNRTNKSTYEINIKNNNKVISKITLNASKIKDGKYNIYKMNPTKFEKGKTYQLSVKRIKGNDDNVIAVFNNDKTKETAYLLGQTKPLWNGKTAMCLIFILGFFLINYFINTKKLTYKHFFIIYTIYVFIALFTYPPFQIPDDRAHYTQAIAVSQKNLIKEIQEGKIKLTETVPKNSACLNYSNTIHSGKIEDYNDIAKCIKSESETKKEDSSYMKLSNPIQHIIPSIAVKIADTFSDSPMVIYFSGRILVVIVSLLVLFYTLFITPKKYKPLVFFIMMMPMFIQQIISYSYDSVLNVLCLLLIALFLNLRESKRKVTKKDLSIMSIVGVFIVAIKLIYLPILLIFLLLDKEQFGSMKKKIWKLLIPIIVTIIAYEGWSFIISLMNTSNALSVEGNKLQYLLETPLRIPLIIVNTFVEKGYYYLEGLFGNFGWLNFGFDFITIMVYLAVLFIITLSIKDNFTNKQKLIIASIIALLFALIEAALYFAWTPIGILHVEGVQGRYFFPLLLPFLLVFTPRKWKLNMTDKTMYSFVNIILLEFIIIIFTKFY